MNSKEESTWIERNLTNILIFFIVLFLFFSTLSFILFLLQLSKVFELANLSQVLDIIGIISTIATLILFIFFNIWNNKKSDSRLERSLEESRKQLKKTQFEAEKRLKRTLNKNILLRNNRVQKTYDLFKEFFEKIIYMQDIKKKELLNIGFKFEISGWSNSTTHRQKEQELKSMIKPISEIEDGFKCLSISTESSNNNIYFSNHRYTLQLNSQEIYINKENNREKYKNGEKEDLIEKILLELRVSAKKYYDIEIQKMYL